MPRLGISRSHEPAHDAFAILRVGYALSDRFLLAYSGVRHLSVQRALERDEFTVMPTVDAVSLASTDSCSGLVRSRSFWVEGA